MKCGEIIELLSNLSPKQYACDWDNVGLLVGRRNQEVQKIVVSLDATVEVVQYAVKHNAQMLVTHHPMIFSSLKQVNEDNFISEKILQLAEHGISYYAMHTNFDAVGGMADLAASEKYLNLKETMPIELCEQSTEGMGRYGVLPKPMTATELAEFVKERFGLSFVMLYQGSQDKDHVFEKIAVMPGSGKSVMKEVKKKGYDLLLTGDYGHHEGLDAIDMGMTVIDATHYGLEHIFISYVADYLREKMGTQEVEVLECDCGCPVQIL